MPRARERISSSAASTSSPKPRSTAAVSPSVEPLRGELELDPQRDEPLLRTVVQVALDPAALVVRRGLDARARLAHLLQQRRRLGREAVVVQRHQRVRRRGGDEGRVLASAASWTIVRDEAITVANLGQAAPGRDGRPLDAVAVRVGPAVSSPSER